MKIRKDTLIKLLNAKGSDKLPELECSGVEFDSRAVKQGQLFVALKGENSHGHQFVDKALELGASLVLVEDPKFLSKKTADKVIVVDDTLKAFQQLATYFRAQFKGKVLAVTGSMGKTTIKQMTQTILSEHSSGSYSKGSYNNHVGVPYTICNANIDDSWWVLEMGMNHTGELSVLTKIGAPDVAIISCIAPVHMEYFKDLNEVAAAKLEILEGLTENSIAIINKDYELLIQEFEKWNDKQPKNLKTVYFGTDKNSDIQLSNVKELGLGGLSFTLTNNYNGKPSNAFDVSTNCLGVHNAGNFTAAAAAALSLSLIHI